MGGSGSINGMFAMRGHPGDYDQWAQMGARGWSYADVLPYFRRLEDSWRGEGAYHGAGGPVRIKAIDLPVLHHERMMETAAQSRLHAQRGSWRRAARRASPAAR